MDNNTLYIVVPCYNEEEALPLSAPVLRAKLEQLISAGLAGTASRILLVDDGSRDGTWNIIKELHGKDQRFSALRLSRNRGHQNALLAGLEYAAAHGDVTISIDADLQDDVNAMDDMLRRYGEGCDIVYGVRSARDTDTFAKRFTAEGYYKLIAALGGEVVFNHADYRLMSSRAVRALLEFPERSLFLRGMVPMIGYRTASVEYERGSRNAGESKYTLKKMLTLAINGITALSAKPIRMISCFGALLFAAGVAAIIVMLIAGAPGAAIAAVSAWGAAGLVLLALGIVGEYISHIYEEVKGRPRYFIMDTLD